MLSRTFAGVTIALIATMFIGASLLPRPVARAADLKVCGSSDVQFLGFSDALNKKSVGGFPLSELSAIAYDPQRGVYLVQADRVGSTQAHMFTLTVPIDGDTMGTPFVSTVVKLADKTGNWFTGINLDGEGIALVAAAICTSRLKAEP